MQCLNYRDVYKVRELHVPHEVLHVVFTLLLHVASHCCASCHHPQNYPEIFPKNTYFMSVVSISVQHQQQIYWTVA